MREISQRFTALGWTGVVCLICGPILAIQAGWPLLQATYWSGVDPNAFSVGHGAFNLWGFAIGGIATLVSLPLIVIGRKFRVDAVQ